MVKSVLPSIRDTDFFNLLTETLTMMVHPNITFTTLEQDQKVSYD